MRGEEDEMDYISYVLIRSSQGLKYSGSFIQGKFPNPTSDPPSAANLRYFFYIVYVAMYNLVRANSQLIKRDIRYKDISCQ